MSNTAQEFWNRFIEIAPLKPTAPPSTLYDVIADGWGIEVVRQFLEGGHDINQRFMGGTALGLAINRADPELVTFLVQSGADVDGADGTLLHKAVVSIAEAEDPERAFAVLDYLLAQSPRESTLLQGFTTCILPKQYTAAAKIVAAGLGPDAKVYYDYQKYRRLDDTLSRDGHAEFLNILNGATPTEAMLKAEQQERTRNAKTRRPGRSVRRVESERAVDDDDSLKQQRRTLREEIEAGRWDDYLKASAGAPRKKSPLVFAAGRGLSEFVPPLLKVGCDPLELRDAAKAAATHGYLPILEAVCPALKDANESLDQALMAAAKHGQLACVDYLLNQGANPRAADSNGHTPVMLAGGPGKRQIVTRLREAAAGSPPAFRSGYDVKGKAQDWAKKRKAALEAGLNHGIYLPCWVRSDGARVGEALSKSLSGQPVYDLAKTPLPFTDGIVFYQLAESEWTCLLPYMDRDALYNRYPALIQTHARHLSDELNTDVCLLILDDTSGTEEIHRWVSGDHQVSHDDAESQLAALDIVPVPHAVEDNGFEARLILKKIKKSQVKTAGFIELGAR